MLNNKIIKILLLSLIFFSVNIKNTFAEVIDITENKSPGEVPAGNEYNFAADVTVQLGDAVRGFKRVTASKAGMGTLDFVANNHTFGIAGGVGDKTNPIKKIVFNGSNNTLAQKGSNGIYTQNIELNDIGNRFAVNAKGVYTDNLTVRGTNSTAYFQITGGLYINNGGKISLKDSTNRIFSDTSIYIASNSSVDLILDAKLYSSKEDKVNAFISSDIIVIDPTTKFKVSYEGIKFVDKDKNLQAIMEASNGFGKDGIDLKALNANLTDDSALFDSHFILGGKDNILYLVSTKAERKIVTGKNSAIHTRIKNAVAGTALASMNTKLDTFTTDAQKNAFINANLKPRKNNAAVTASIGATTKVNNIISTRVSNPVSNIGGTTNISDAGSSTSGIATGNKIGDVYSWGQIFGNKSSQGVRKGEQGYDADTQGFVFGFDTQVIGDKLKNILGVAIAYANIAVDDKSESDQQTDINSYQISLYSNTSKKGKALGLYNSNIVNVSFNQYKSNRIVSGVGIAESDYNGIQYGAKTEFGYSLRTKYMDNTVFTPYASLGFSRLRLESYQEQGVDNAGMTLDGSNFNTLYSDLGARIVTKSFNTNLPIFSKAVPEFTTSWTRNFKDDGQKSTVYVAGETSTTTGVDIHKNIYNLGATIKLYQEDTDSSLDLGYDLQYAHSYRSHGLLLKYRFRF